VNDRSRPAKAAPEVIAATIEIVPQVDPAPHPTRRHTYAVLVHAQRRDGIIAQHVLVNLPAAERRVLRTRERGLVAWLELVRLTPVTEGEVPL